LPCRTKTTYDKVLEDLMAEHVLHKKENKKAPQKTLKEKREEKKNKKKGSSSSIPNS